MATKITKSQNHKITGGGGDVIGVIEGDKCDRDQRDQRDHRDHRDDSDLSVDSDFSSVSSVSKVSSVSPEVLLVKERRCSFFA